MTGLRFKLHSSVRLTDRFGTHQWFYVRESRRDGYLFEPYGSPGERHLHLHDAILEQYALGRVVYQPFDMSLMSDAREARSRQSWEALPRDKQLVAQRREKILKEVKKAIAAGMTSGEALKAVPRDVVSRHASAWEKEDFALASERFEREKESGVHHDEGADPETPRPFAVPSARTVWEWLSRYLEMGENILALVRYDENKGRGNQLSAEVDGAIEAYLDHVIKEKLHGRPYTFLHSQLEILLKVKGLDAPSIITFTKRFKKKVPRYEVIAVSQGKRAADQSRNIAEYVPEPEWAGEQVEIDHTLANVHLKCDVTKLVLGRPWITMVLDRKTRVILGCHVSFLAPSWATLSRAIAHAIWFKDLSQYPDRAGRWNHHGVFDWAYTDRGMDFISNSGRRAGAFVGFDIANLPGFSPWLKGKIERCFGTMALQCFNYKDGLTSIKKPNYNPRKNASIFVSKFKADLIDWIIDHNHREHGAHGGSRSPDDVWQASIDLIGGVKPVRNVSTLRRMIGKSAYPKIGNHGVRVLGLEYVHPRMEELRGLDDLAGRRFEVRYDPYNLAAVDFHDGNEWLTAHARHPDVADGVTAWQHTFHMDFARARAKERVVTVDMVAEVKALAQADMDLLKHQLGKSKLRTNGSKIAQYLDVGEFLTPISLIPQRSIALPLEVPGSILVENGRYLVPPRPDYGAEAEPEKGTQPILVQKPKPSAPRRASKPKVTKAPEPPASQSAVDRIQARLEANRQARGVS